MALVSSLLAECGGNSSEKIRVAVRLFSGSSMTVSSNEITKLLDAVFGSLSSGLASDRIAFWNILPAITKSSHVTLALSHLCTLASKIHLYIQTARAEEERNSICNGLRCILELEAHHENLYLKLENVLSKFVSSILKLVKSESKPGDCLYGLQVLQALYQHRGRAVNVSHGSAVTSACLNIILLQSDVCSSGRSVSSGCNLSFEVRSLAATVLGQNTSFGPTEQYENTWKNLTIEYSNVLLELGLLRKPTSSQKSIKCNSAVASKTRMGTSGCRGAAKAMELEVVFQGITQALLEMYWHGCASGPVVLDLSSVLITVIGTAVCHRVDMKQDDPKFCIPNASSIAPVHVALVSNQLKVHAMRLLDVLMTQPQQCLPASSLLGVCCTCLSTIFSSSSDRTAATKTTGSGCDVAVINIALSCFRNAIRCYPTVVMQRCFGAVQNIVSMLAAAMVEHTSSDAIQDAATVAEMSSKKSSGHFSVAKLSITQKLASSLDICDLIHTCEMLLLMASPLLDVDTRQSLEHSVAVGLRCVCKGVMFADSYRMSTTATTNTLLSLATMSGTGSGGSSATSRPQKRMKRATCEPLRTNMTALNALLRLATSEVSAPYPDGSRSGNMTLLKMSASACVGVDVLSLEAARVCRYVEAVLFPVSSNIPGIPVGPAALDSYPVDNSSVAYAERTIADHLNFAANAPSQSSDQFTVTTVEAAIASNDTNHSAPFIATQKGAGFFGGVLSDSKEQAIATNHVDSVNSSSKSLGDSSKKRLFSSSLGVDDSSSVNVVSAGASSDNESDDDELPDLDVDADPDQM